MRAMRRIEQLEQQDLTERVAAKGPDEVFALNEVQVQIDNLVNRMNMMNDTMNERIQGVENLTGSMAHKEEEKTSTELRGLMANLKSKFTFLDPATEEKQQRNLATQVAILEERFDSISQLVTGKGQTASVEERFDAIASRLDQTDHMLESIGQRLKR